MPTWPWPPPADDGAARHLVSGLALPHIALPATTGGLVDLADVPGRSVVFFYPWTGRPGLPNPPGWDDIPGAHGSTPEAEGFRDLYSDYATNGFGIYGVSLQPPAEQHEFAARAGLPFALLSDVENRFSGQLGLPTFEAAGTVYLKRLTMVVANGVVLRAVYPVHPPDTHAADLLDSLLC